MYSIDTTQNGRWIRGWLACAAIGGAVAIGACSSDSSGNSTPQQTGGAGGSGASAGSAGVAGSAGEAGHDAAAGGGGGVAGSGGSVGDAASETSSEDADAAAKCEPQSISGWTPTNHPPTGLYQGKCAAGEVKAVMDGCFGKTATQATCTAAQSAHGGCVACLISKDTDASWGPIVEYTKLGFYDRNAGGCFGLLQGDVSATGCGSKINAVFDCNLASCSAVCPVKTDADFAALNECFGAADADPDICKPSVDTSTKCWNDGLAEDGGAKYQPCIWDSKKEPWAAVAERIGEVFCGVGPGDAATE